MADEDVKQGVNLSLRLEIDRNLTYAELFRFVDIARRSVPESMVNEMIPYDSDEDGRVTALLAYLNDDEIRAAGQPAD